MIIPAGEMPREILLDSFIQCDRRGIGGALKMPAQCPTPGRQWWADMAEPKNHGASRNRRSWRRSGGSKTRV